MERKFCDLHIYSNLSLGQNSVKDIIKMAEKLDLSSICIIDYVKDKTKDNIDNLKKEIKKEKPKIEVLTGVEISTEDLEILKKQINKLRNKADILIVSGGLSKINRAAVENPRVDILAHPEMGRRDSGIDNVTAKLAADNSVAIELNFKYVLNSYKKIRAHMLTHMKTNVTLAKKYKTPFIIASGAQNIYDMRTGRELASLGSLLDLELAESLYAVSAMPEMIAQHTKKVRSKGHIMPGVEVLEK